MQSVWHGVVAAVIALGASAASAAPVLDQNNTPNFNVGFCGGDCEWQQQVTAGVSGLLTGVEMFGFGPEELRIGLGAAFSHGPFLFDQVVPVATVVDVSAAHIIVTAGSHFVLDVIHAAEELGPNIPYAGGDLWLNLPGIFFQDYTQSFGYSLGFKTFVDPSAIPEPCSLVLMATGLLGLGAMRARKSSKRDAIAA
jgi:hypothetical protein